MNGHSGAVVFRAEGISKAWSTLVLDRVSLELRVGEVHALMGSNGAGKTSTLSILSGEMLATGGGARLAGYDVFTQQPLVRRLLGYW